MTVAAGTASLAQESLRVTLADATAFRALLSPAMTQAQALARIYLEGLPPPGSGHVHTKTELEALRPYAIIWTDPSNGLRMELDAIDSFASHGRLMVRIEQNAPSGLGSEPTSDANLQFRNSIGQIMDDVAALVAPRQAGYLAVTAIDLEEGIYWNHPKVEPAFGVYQGAVLAVEWSD